MNKLLLIFGIVQMLSPSTKAGCSLYLRGNKAMPLNLGDSVTLIFGMTSEIGGCALPTLPQWYRNDTLIDGANKLTYVAKKAGKYKMVGYNLSFTVTYITPTAVSYIDLNKTIILYPNPNNGIFKLSIDNIDLDRQHTILIYDVLGKFVQKQELMDEISDIDISTQPKGIYFIKVMNEDREVKVDKIVYQ